MKKFLVFALALMATMMLTACSLGDKLSGLLAEINEALATFEESETEQESSQGDAQDTQPAPSVSLQDNQTIEEHRDTQGRLVYYQIKTFDDQNRLIRRATYAPNGSELCALDHTYREDGQILTGSWCFTRDGLLMPIDYYYDEKGFLIQRWNHGSEQYNTVGNMTFYTNDENGLAIEKEYYEVWREDGTYGEPCYIFCEYNENGKLTKETGYHQPDKQNKSYTRVYEWNDFGKMAKDTRYNGTDQMEYYTTYLYDGETCIGMQTFNPDGTLKNETRYDK